TARVDRPSRIDRRPGRGMTPPRQRVSPPLWARVSHRREPVMQGVDIGVYLQTYSTLASTLAGAFGFLVAVVLYVMQGINMHISNCAEALVIGSPADRHRLKQLQSSGKWDEIIQLHAHAGQENRTLDADENRRMDEQFQEMRRS